MYVSSLIPYDNPMKSSRLREVKKPALGHTGGWTELRSEHSTLIPRSPTVAEVETFLLGIPAQEASRDQPEE